MKVACPSCSTNLNIDDSKIPPGGARIKCPTCQNVFPVKPQAAGAAVPLPGGSAPPPRPAHRPGAVPLPGLTAAAPQATSSNEEKTRVGDAGPAGMQFDDATNTAPAPAPAPAPGRGGAVPLPGSTKSPGPATSQMRSPAPGRGAAVPLPGASGGSAGGGFDFQDLPSPKGTGPARAPAPTHDPAQSLDFEDLPSPKGASGGGFEFDDAPPPPPVPRGRAKSAPEPDNLPSPSYGSDLPTPALSDLPMPSTPDLPSPAEFDAGGGLGFDLGAPPPAAPPRAVVPTSGFGEVDLGGGADSLEFDPTAGPKQDDLEADLSAPLPPPRASGPADGMEMLGFIDQQAKEAGVKDAQVKVRRFHIKRRSGKVFGPFDEAVVVKMLEDGQLLGNEEVSLDAESWQPIGAEAGFQGAIARLMESPSKSMATAIPGGADAGAAGANQQNASMERLKQLYEGRMAAVAVVESKLPISNAARIPLIALLVLIVGAIGTGLFLATTPYGLFGVKKLFPARVRSGTREFQDLAGARAAMLKDHFLAYKEARDAALTTLKVKEYPEARAVWCQTIFHLHRKYDQATPAELAEATKQLENIQLLGKKHVEVVKAMAGAALVRGSADEALTHLADALARSENQGDLELYFLRAEAFALKRQFPQAMSDLKAALDKDKASSRALHEMGELHLQQKEVDLAVGRFTEALKVDPDHLESGIELAAIALHQRKDPVKAQAALDMVLAEAQRPKLAPDELGRGLAYRGEVLASQYKWKDANAIFEEALKADPKGARAKYAYGRSLLAVSDVDKALPMLKDAYDSDTKNIDYVDAYLSALIERGKMDDALRVVNEANKQFPGNAKLAYFAARVDDVLDRAKDAEASYLRAISADPSLIEANLNLARLYLRFRRLKDAKPQLEAALTRAPENALIHLGLGELALAENDPDRADRSFKKVTSLDPNMAEGYLGQSQVALKEDKLDIAAQFADKALQLNPRVRGGRLQRGTTLWKLGKLDEAQRELEQGRQDDPRTVALSTTLGAVLLEKGDLNGAITALSAATQAEPNNPEANFYLARVKNKKAEHSQAIELMKKALDSAGKRAEYNYWMGRIYLDARKVPEAMDQWKLALQIDPRHTDTLEAMGRLLLDRNQVKQSVQYFERALEVDPQRNAARAAIGDAYSVAERWDDAIKSYTRALELAPDLPGVHFKLAQAYFERKKYAEAIDWFKKATVKEPENPLAYLNLGWAYKEKKMKPQAIAAFKQYLARRPDAENKKEIEDQIDYLGGER